MADKIGGYLEVGTNDHGEVYINHPDLKPDENGVGHIIFSPAQARGLAALLWAHAFRIDRSRELVVDLNEAVEAVGLPDEQDD